MSKKVSTTIYITAEQQELLRQLNLRTRVPVAEYIRQGIDLVLDRYKSQLPGQMELSHLPPGTEKPEVFVDPIG